MAREAEKPNIVIRDWIKNGGGEEWAFKDLAADLYTAEEAMRFTWFSPKNGDDYVMPQSVIGFEKTHLNILASYSLIPDSVGLRFRITFNTVHVRRPLWSLYETLVHEMMHLHIEENPTIEKKAKGHGPQFVSWLEEIGIHARVGSGMHWKAADGQFERLMNRWSVPRPKEAERVVPKESPKDNWWDAGPRPKGSSTLRAYVCDSCVHRPICKPRSGRIDLHLLCEDCGGKFYLLL